MPDKILIEFFCGSKTVADTFKEHGYKTFTIDINPKFEPDLCIDILEFEIAMLPSWIKEALAKPDTKLVIWASPPCTTFSVASISIYWDNRKPKSWKTYIGLAIAKKTIELVKQLDPEFYFIENPSGMLRNQTFMQELYRKTVTYCQYGERVQKATDIWTNAYHWVPKPICGPMSPCHERASMGSKTELQGISGSKRDDGVHPDFDYVFNRSGGSNFMRAKIPKQLCKEIVDVCENKVKVRQLQIQEVKEDAKNQESEL